MEKKETDAVDWEKLMWEYAETDISMRKLAEKYGVNSSTLQHHARVEKWTEKRAKVRRKADAKLIQKAANQRASLVELSERFCHESLQEALDGLHSLSKMNSTKVTRSFIDKKGEKPGNVNVEIEMRVYLTMAMQAMKAMGLDAASILARERFEFEKAQQTGEEDGSANDNIMSIAELINHPMPDRDISETEQEGGDGDD